jgi:hypothetical protein
LTSDQRRRSLLTAIIWKVERSTNNEIELGDP